MPKALKKMSVAARLLDELLVMIDELGDAYYHPMAIQAAGGFDAYRERKVWQMEKARRQALRRLQEQKYLTIRKRGGKMSVRLTNKGFSYALKRTITTRRKSLPDGQRCYVSFDIPEKVRRLRSLFRGILKDAKFHMTHQSLWWSTRDVGKELALLVKQLDAKDWIHVYIGRPLTKV